MYTRVSKLIGQSVVSLQTSHVVGWVNQPILDISNLEIVALGCLSPHHKGQVLLMSDDIRQFAPDCIIIDAEDELTDPDDIVRLTSILKQNYTPLEKTVVADTGRKLGTVDDYTINLETNRVQKLYVRRPFLHAWFSPNLIIDRTQIIDISPQRITVRDATVANPILAPESLPEINP